MTGKHYDAIVVGGGVIGSAIAFYLSKKDFQVLLLEKGRIASQSSSAAAGMLGVQTEMEDRGPLYELARKSRSMFPRLSAELREITGCDIGFMQNGMLKIAYTDDQVEHYRQIGNWQRRAGEKADWLEKEEVFHLEPCVGNDILGALQFPDEGQVSAPDLSLAFAKAAAVYGAKIREFTEVLSMVTTAGRVEGVSTNAGNFYSESVIVAAGAWSGRWLQEEEKPSSPVYPVKGEAFSVTAHQPFVNHTIFTPECYIVPKRGGEMVIGATMTEHTFGQTPTLGGISSLMEKAKALLPIIGTAEISRIWAGTRPTAYDGLPFLGEHGETGGLYFATGHYRNGILLSPATGEIIANLIAGEKPVDIDLAPFHPCRHRKTTEVNRDEAHHKRPIPKHTRTHQHR